MNNLHDLEKLVTQVRRDILRMVHKVNSGHPGGSLGCAEYFVALYNEIMTQDTSFDMDGKGEVVGGIVVMRYGENANKVIEAVKAKMKEVEKGLPEGVTFKTSYDRSTLIQEAVQSVKGTLIEEMIAVSLIVLIFLFHWRSAVIILISRGRTTQVRIYFI